MNCKLGLFFLAVCLSFGSCGPVGKEADAIVDPEDGFLDATTPAAPLAFLEKWDGWQAWEAPEKILNMVTYYKSGYDYDGLPIITAEFGKWNYRELAKFQPDQLNDFWRHYEQFIRRAQSEGAANNKAGIVFICDWDGFALGHYASGKALELALKAFTSVIRLNGVVRYGYQINTNFGAETFVNIARPFLGSFLEKFEIYGGQRAKWRSALLRKIPSSQLPPEYGGYKDWKPIPWDKEKLSE